MSRWKLYTILIVVLAGAIFGVNYFASQSKVGQDLASTVKSEPAVSEPNATGEEAVEPEEEKPEEEGSVEQSEADADSEKAVDEDADGEGEPEAVDGEGQQRPEGQWPGGQGFEGRRGRGERPDRGQGEVAAEDDAANDVDPETGEKLESLNLNNVEMKNIIKIIAEWTKKPVIPYDDDVMKTRITIYSTQKMTRKEALGLLYQTLRNKGYIADENDKVIVLKPLSQARLGSVPVVEAEFPLARIEDKQKIVEKFFRIENYSPSQLSQVLTPLVAEYGHITVDETTKTVSVIDTVQNLMRIEQTIKQLDIPEAGQMQTQVFELKSADPAEIVQLIEMLLNTKGGSSSSNSSRDRRRGDNDQASSVVISTSKVPLVLIPETKRGWIVAKGAPEDILAVEKWVLKLDTPEQVKAEQSVISVKYADVNEVANAVNRTLSNMPGQKLRSNVIVQPLTQARQIVVYGSEENRMIVEKLIEEVDIPDTDMFSQETFVLEHADADKIKENIDELYGDDSSASSYYYRRNTSTKSADTVKSISYPTLHQVTVIASPENLEKIRAQVLEWDKPLDIRRQMYRIIPLQNSDPEQMVELLSTLFTEESSSSSSNNFFRFFSGSDMDSKEKIVGSLYGQLTFEAVPDTKKIIVISKIPEAYDVIEKLVEELDSQEGAEVPKVITLKYADCEDLCDQLNAILNESGTTATVRRTKRGLSDYDASQTSSDSSNNNSSSDSELTNSVSDDEIRPWWTSRSNSANEVPISNLIGQIRFIPVQRSKAILVLAPPKYMEDIEKMIVELDQPGNQVMVKAVILAIDRKDLSSLGVQLATDAAAFGNLGENAVQAVSELSTGFERGSFSLSATSDINLLIDFLQKKVNARVLNQPTLWTKDNEEAVFFKGQNLPFVVSSNTSSEGTNTKDSVEYQPVGVTLRVRPNITPEKAVDTTINLGISQKEAEEIKGNIVTSELNTTTHVIVNDGETIMLGGILFQEKNQIFRKIPLFGDIPLIGGLFTHTDDVVANTELIVFITPYVVEQESLGDPDKMPFKEELKKLGETREILDDSVDMMNDRIDKQFKEGEYEPKQK